MRPARTARMTLVLTVVLCIAEIALGNEPPVADAGLPRYAGADPIRLDGTQSYDPDTSGVLTYAWVQTDGPSVKIADTDSPTPRIGGVGTRGALSRFLQTDEIQICRFELVVSDGELVSSPDTVEVIIVPDFGSTTLDPENPPFDPDRPTVIYFGGGDCVTGGAGQRWGNWYDRANVISCGYGPDGVSAESWRTYYHYGDMIIVYLCSVAAEYNGMIQTIGWSTGGQPAVDAAIRLNRFYHDPRYAVNQVTELDAPCRWQFTSWEAYVASNELLHSSAVDGEPLRHDHYWGEAYRLTNVPRDLLGVYLEGHDHAGARDWYRNSLAVEAANNFNHGVVAGAYWSVVGPGKNLQMTTDNIGYYFHWTTDGGMTMFSEEQYPGSLPEPVILAAWASLSDDSGAIDGTVLSCQYSENAANYELLLGSDAHRMADYEVVSDTPAPPLHVMRDLPPEVTWWTIRVRDQYGSTIYADPVPLDPTDLQPPGVQNARTGKKYGLIDHAIVDAEPGDRILLEPGTYAESIEFDEKSLTVSSLDPDDPVVVAGTIVTGQIGLPTVVFSDQGSAECVLDGLTIQSETVGIACRDASPTIRNCVVECPNSVAIEHWYGRAPRLVDCTVLGQVVEQADPGLIVHWKLDETEGLIAHDNVGALNGTVAGDAVWRPEGGFTGGALEFDGVDDFVTADLILDPTNGPFSIHVWIKGGMPGQVVLSQADTHTGRFVNPGCSWLAIDPVHGTLTTDLASPEFVASAPEAVITDGQWHRVGLAWDNTSYTSTLYIDDIEIIAGLQPIVPTASGDLQLGVGRNMAPDTFFTGLIDDLHVYDRAVKP